MSMNRFNTVNRQVLCGELGADAESRATAGGSPVVNLRVVTYGEFRDQGTQEFRDIAENHRVVIFGKPAEALRELKKGTVVYVEGRTRTRKFRSQGDTQDRYMTEVVVAGMEGRCFVHGAADSAAGFPASQPGAQPAPQARARPAASTPTNPEPTSAWDDNGDTDPPY